jgi:acyl carrier protein
MGAGSGLALNSGCIAMPQQTPAEHELAELLVTSLNLDEVKAADIDPDAALFGADLGLDSIDALELSLAVSQCYGVQLRSDNSDNKKIFSSLRALSAHIQQQRAA